MSGLVVTVVVGTDHHPFQRLVDWADERQRSHPQDRVTVQHGYTGPPRTAAGVRLMPPQELHDLLAGSDVVITHGGPGTVMGARNAGHLPLVLPRDPAHGEHVDGHQMRFAAWAAQKGLVRLVGGLAELDAAVAALGAEGTRSEASVGHATRDSALRLASLLQDAERLGGRRVPAPGAVRVVYLVGEAAALRRAGDLLARVPTAVVLGDVAGALATGPEARCSCGRSPGGCDFWSGTSAFTGDGADALRDVAAARSGASGRTDALRCSGIHRDVYLGVAPQAAEPAAGGAVVVDCGGSSSVAVALGRDRRLDLRVLEVVEPSAGRRRGAAPLRTRRDLLRLRRAGVPVARLVLPAPGLDATDAVRAAWGALGLQPPDALGPVPDSHALVRPTT